MVRNSKEHSFLDCHADAEIFLQERHPKLLLSFLGKDPDADIDSDEERVETKFEKVDESFSAWCHGKCFDPLCAVHYQNPTEPDIKKPKKTPQSKTKKTRNSFSALKRASGLKWQIVPGTLPAGGRRLNNPPLASALTHMLEFTQEQWDEFGIDDLLPDHFIVSGKSCFTPAPQNVSDLRGDPITALLKHIAAAGQLKFRDGFSYASMQQVVMSEVSQAKLAAYLETYSVDSLEELLTPLPPAVLKSQQPTPLPVESLVPGVQIVRSNDLSGVGGDRIRYQYRPSHLAPFAVIALRDVESKSRGGGLPSIRAGEKLACIEYGEKTVRIARLQPRAPAAHTNRQHDLRLKIEEFPNSFFQPLHETSRSLQDLVELLVHDMWSFSLHERNLFQHYIFEHIKEDLIADLGSEWRKTATNIKELKSVEDSIDLAILKVACPNVRYEIAQRYV